MNEWKDKMYNKKSRQVLSHI